MKVWIYALLAAAALAQPAERIAKDDLDSIKTKMVAAYGARDKVESIIRARDAEITAVKEKYEAMIREAELERVMKLKAAREEVIRIRKAGNIAESCNPNVESGDWDCPEAKSKQ